MHFDIHCENIELEHVFSAADKFKEATLKSFINSLGKMKYDDINQYQDDTDGTIILHQNSKTVTSPSNQGIRSATSFTIPLNYDTRKVLLEAFNELYGYLYG